MAQLALNEAMQSIDRGQPNISLIHERLGSAGAVDLAKTLETNRTIRLLELEGNALEDDGAAALAKMLGVNGTIKMMDLTCNRIGDKGACKLAEKLDVNQSLEQLDISGNLVRSTGGTSLARALRSNSIIQHLSLNGNKVGYKGAKAFAEALETNRTLKILNLTGNCVGDVGVSAVAKALSKEESALSELSLGSNGITDAGATNLAEMLKVNEGLRELQVDYNFIKDRGGIALAEAVELNHTLQTLWAVKNPLGSQAVERFSLALETNKKIRRLGLSCTSSIRPEVMKQMERVRRERLASEGKVPFATESAPAVPGPAPTVVAFPQTRSTPRTPSSASRADAAAAATDRTTPRAVDSAETLRRHGESSRSPSSPDFGATGQASSASSPDFGGAKANGATPRMPRSARSSPRSALGESPRGPDRMEPPSDDLLAEIQFLDDQLLFMDMNAERGDVASGSRPQLMPPPNWE